MDCRLVEGGDRSSVRARSANLAGLATELGGAAIVASCCKTGAGAAVETASAKTGAGCAQCPLTG
jgi:hypothetical protein